MYVYFTHCVGGHYLHVRSREAKTVTEKDRGSKRWVPTSHSTGPRELVCGPERSCVHILYSLSREMFVHNSGARNVIHLFASWRRVLQNIDERQSVGEKKRMHVWARPRGGGVEWRLQMNEFEKVTLRMTGTERGRDRWVHRRWDRNG